MREASAMVSTTGSLRTLVAYENVEWFCVLYARICLISRDTGRPTRGHKGRPAWMAARQTMVAALRGATL